MILEKEEILKRIKKEKLIENFIDLGRQLQGASFDLTFDKIYKFEGAGKVDFDNSSRKISDVEEIHFEGEVHLPPGAYRITFNEIINMPSDLAAISIVRSSVGRSGVSIITGFWDPGYTGRSASVLLVHNPFGIDLKKNARIVQIIFFKLTGSSSKLYQGIHQAEGLNTIPQK